MSGVQIGPGATAFTRMPRSARFCGQRAGEGHDRSLGGRVVEQRRAAAVAVTEVVLMMAQPGAEVRQRGRRQVEHREDVRPEGPFELVAG